MPVYLQATSATSGDASWGSAPGGAGATWYSAQPTVPTAEQIASGDYDNFAIYSSGAAATTTVTLPLTTSGVARMIRFVFISNTDTDAKLRLTRSGSDSFRGISTGATYIELGNFLTNGIIYSAATLTHNADGYWYCFSNIFAPA